MRNLILWLSAFACLTPASAGAADAWTDPLPGVRRLHRTGGSQNVNVLVVDLCAAGVSVRATAKGERGRTVSSFATLVGAQAAVNGDFYVSGFGTDGPSIGAGESWGGADHGYVAPALFGSRQVALPEHGATGGAPAWAKEAVSGHPTLLFQGQVRGNNGDALCTNRHPRTVLGFNADKTKLFMAVIDGRATGRLGMTCDEMIALFQGLGASDAVNLDGGGSSTMWVAGPGVVNFPSDGSQRVVANHLAVRATGSGEAVHCPYHAELAGQQAPSAMTSGEESLVWLDFTNKGSATWDVTHTKLGAQDPRDRASSFFKAGSWAAPDRPSAAGANFAPGTLGRFSFVMLAPEVDESTDFEETFQPVQERVTWFGPKVTLKIKVNPRSGPTLVSDSGQTTDPPGKSDGASPEGEVPAGAAGCQVANQSGGAAPLAWGLAVLAMTLTARRRRTRSLIG